jgi:hypothetical protein
MEDAEPQGGTAPDLKADVQIEATHKSPLLIEQSFCVLTIGMTAVEKGGKVSR